MNEVHEPRAMLSALEQSGFSQQGFRTDTLDFREIEGVSKVRLRAASGAGVNDTGGINLPASTGQCSEGDPAVLCLRPGEWLAVSETQTPQALLALAREGHDPTRVFAWDQSDGLALFRIEGAAAAWLLRKHCGLDFHISATTPTHCAQARFAHTSVLIHYRAGASTQGFDVYVDRSLAKYLWELMADSAPHAIEMQSEYGVRGRGQS